MTTIASLSLNFDPLHVIPLLFPLLYSFLLSFSLFLSFFFLSLFLFCSPLFCGSAIHERRRAATAFGSLESKVPWGTVATTSERLFFPFASFPSRNKGTPRDEDRFSVYLGRPKYAFRFSTTGSRSKTYN